MQVHVRCRTHAAADTMQIDAAVEAEVPPCGFLDVSEGVSVQLSDDIINALALMSEAVHRQTQQGYKLLAGRFVASPGFLDLCRETARQAGMARAEHDLVHGADNSSDNSSSIGAGSVNAGRSVIAGV